MAVHDSKLNLVDTKYLPRSTLGSSSVHVKCDAVFLTCEM